MSLSIVYTRAMCGTDAPRVRVETHLSNGLPSFSLVGLPEAAVKESRERVRSALLNCGFEFPMRRLTLNLAPADLPKEGGRFDLAIAIGILVASGQIDASRVEGAEFLAELALNGEICSVRGVLPSLLAAENQAKCMFVSTDDQQYSRMIESNKIFGAKDLLSLVQYLREPDAYPLPICGAPANSHDSSERQEKDLADVAGQHAAKHALEVAASGGHNLLFYGPPGTGKSMLASRITSILPRLSTKDALDVASLYTLTDSPRSMAEWERPPYRAPHHSCSSVALVGGGVKPKPGEASLAHKGVLFLDELPEFSRQSLEMLREPLEIGEISIARAQRSVTLPARFQLIAAMNPCPCGHLGHPSIPCRDTPQQIEQYRRKLSGPLLDRIDMHVEVPFQSAEFCLKGRRKAEPSDRIRARVESVREMQMKRQNCLNAELEGDRLLEICDLSSEQLTWLARTIDALALSGRSTHRVLRLARTLADCAGRQQIEQGHLASALRYRPIRQQ